jgi:hypothetical protein
MKASKSKQPNQFHQLWANKIDAEFIGDMEFMIVECDVTGAVCVDCGKKIKLGDDRLIMLSKLAKDGKNRTSYHVDCFVSVHKVVFKKMAESICMALMSK